MFILELNKIYLGDCLPLMKEIPDKSIDLVITDPPYGIGEDGGHNSRIPAARSEREHIRRLNNPKYISHEWDNKTPEQTYFDEIFRISKNQIIFGANHFISKLPLDSSCWIVWDKCNGESDFADCELAWTSFKSAVRMFSYHKFTGLHGGLDCIHPTQKPVKLFEWIIKNYAKEGDTICDPFFGSGSCLVAAVRMGHQFIGFEKEKTYFEKAQIRIKAAQSQGKLSGTWF